MTRQGKCTVAAAQDPQAAHGGGFTRVALRQRKLPPWAFDAGDTALVFDCLAELLDDRAHLGGVRRTTVPNQREAQKIAWEFRVTRMENEDSAHAKASAEEASFKDHVVSR